MIDSDARRETRTIQLYLSPAEAQDLLDGLTELLRHSNAGEHFHVIGSDGRELSCSIITEENLRSGRYTALEEQVLKAK